MNDYNWGKSKSDDEEISNVEVTKQINDFVKEIYRVCKMRHER